MNGFNFTERVRKVLALAREEGVRLHHEYVGTEHILLGLIREGEGIAVTILLNLSVELDSVQQAIEERVRNRSVARTTGPDLPYTSPAKRILELSMREAQELHHSYVGTEHLLLGVLAEAKGIAAQVLGSFGVTLEKARAEALRILGPETDPQPTPEPPPGEKPTEIRLILRYSNRAVVMKNFTDAATAGNFLSGL
jgi:ATP-dependent Clp protease ATP-binding subunit ClpC